MGQITGQMRQFKLHGRDRQQLVEHITVVDLEGAEPAPVPLWRWTDAITVLLISENGTVLWYHSNKC